MVDTGLLVAAAIRTDPDHDRCAAFFRESRERLVIPQLVLTEAAYLVGRIAGPAAEAAFVRGVARTPVTLEPVNADDLERIAYLIDTYADLRLGTVDATVIAVAERLNVTTVATLDRRHFTVVGPRHVDAFTLLP
ncbi:MAG TPA: PIN domain-containing protein [Mycobacteriales bacterium]|nr:PIN domain-containing protein [Mycobacteriales bacterium]